MLTQQHAEILLSIPHLNIDIFLTLAKKIIGKRNMSSKNIKIENIQSYIKKLI